jgi:hypothetical protein
MARGLPSPPPPPLWLTGAAADRAAEAQPHSLCPGSCSGCTSHFFHINLGGRSVVNSGKGQARGPKSSISKAQWGTPVVQASLETEARGSLEPANSKPATQDPWEVEEGLGGFLSEPLVVNQCQTS